MESTTNATETDPGPPPLLIKFSSVAAPYVLTYRNAQRNRNESDLGALCLPSPPLPHELPLAGSGHGHLIDWHVSQESHLGNRADPDPEPQDIQTQEIRCWAAPVVLGFNIQDHKDFKTSL